jgi:integrase
MAYTFARIGAVVQLRVADYYIQGRRGWLRLREKGGKVNELPCHHTLEQFLDEYLAAAGIAGDGEGPLFRTWRSGTLQRRPLDQSSAHRMVRRLRQGRHPQPGRQSHRHHQLPQKRRQARTRPADGRSRQPAHDILIRPARR